MQAKASNPFLRTIEPKLLPVLIKKASVFVDLPDQGLELAEDIFTILYCTCDVVPQRADVSSAATLLSRNVFERFSHRLENFIEAVNILLKVRDGFVNNRGSIVELFELICHGC